MKNKSFAAFALFTLVTVGSAWATSDSQPALNPLDQWPHWRGPLVNGISPNGKPPLRWDEKTNIKWKVDLPGKGSATPVIWGDHVFIVAAYDTKKEAKPEDMPKFKPKDASKPGNIIPKTLHQFQLICFDRQTGKERWKKICTERVPHEGHQPTHSFAAGSPTTDGKHVWVSFGSRGVYCFDFDGNLRWQRELGFFYSRTGFGEASTPVLHGNDLIINWDQEYDAKMIVLDAATGQTRIEIDRDEPTTWHTPLVVVHNGVTQVITNGTKNVHGYDLATGKELWRAKGASVNAIPSPVAANGVAYIMAGYNAKIAVAVPLDARGDVSKKVLWTHKKGTPYVPSPLLIDDKLYFTQFNNNFLSCLDVKTGKPLMDAVRLDSLRGIYASPIAAAGRIYIVDQDGMTLVLKQSTNLEVLATNQLKDNIDASPAAVGRQLFLRGHKHLYCIEESGIP